MSKPLQVYLEDADHERLDAWARDHGFTKSQAIRIAVRALTIPPADDPILDLSGMFQGLPADLSQRFEHHLNETYVAENAPSYRASSRGSRSRLRR